MATNKLTVNEQIFLDKLKEMAFFLKTHNPDATSIHLKNDDVERLERIYEKGFKLVITKCENVFSVDGYKIKTVR